MPYSLTPAMTDCARVLGELGATLGRAPTVSELAAELDLCRGRTWRLLDGLVERGWAERRKRRGRRGGGCDYLLLYRPPPLDEAPVELTASGRARLRQGYGGQAHA